MQIKYKIFYEQIISIDSFCSERIDLPALHVRATSWLGSVSVLNFYHHPHIGEKIVQATVYFRCKNVLLCNIAHQEAL